MIELNDGLIATLIALLPTGLLLSATELLNSFDLEANDDDDDGSNIRLTSEGLLAGVECKLSLDKLADGLIRALNEEDSSLRNEPVIRSSFRLPFSWLSKLEL